MRFRNEIATLWVVLTCGLVLCAPAASGQDHGSVKVKGHFVARHVAGLLERGSGAGDRSFLARSGSVQGVARAVLAGGGRTFTAGGMRRERKGRRLRSARRAQSEQRERRLRMSCAVSRAGRDVFNPSRAQQVQRDVAQRCHRLRSSARADPASVFVERDIAYPMDLVLDCPVAPMKLEESGSGRPLSREAREAEMDLALGIGAIQVGDDRLDPEGPRGMREVDVLRRVLSRPDPPHFDPSVPAAVLDVGRGKKTPCP